MVYWLCFSEMSVVERAKGGVSKFHTYTYYYGAALYLRVKISVDGHQLEIDTLLLEDTFLECEQM